MPFIFEFGRNTAWLGVPELNYPYANKDHLATGWTKYTQILTEAMNKKLGTSFNHLLVNQYMPNQKLAMHKDNEPELQGSILSLSLGDTATFKFSTGRGRTSFKSAIDLKDGDFIIGNRSFFNQFYHEVSVPHNAQVRYNLTWRTIERVNS